MAGRSRQNARKCVVIRRKRSLGGVRPKGKSLTEVSGWMWLLPLQCLVYLSNSANILYGIYSCTMKHAEWLDNVWSLFRHDVMPSAGSDSINVYSSSILANAVANVWQFSTNFQNVSTGTPTSRHLLSVLGLFTSANR